MLAIKTCAVLVVTLGVLLVVSESLPTRQRHQVAQVPLIASPGRRFPEPSGGLLRESEDYQDNAAARGAGGADMEAAATLVFRPLFVYRPRGRS